MLDKLQLMSCRLSKLLSFYYVLSVSVDGLINFFYSFKHKAILQIIKEKVSNEEGNNKNILEIHLNISSNV